MEFTLPVIISGVVMILAFMGIIACAKKQQTNPKAQLMAIILIIVVIACGVVILFQTDVIDLNGNSTMNRELAYAKIQAVILGRYLAEKHPGCKVLVIANKNYEKNLRQQKQIEGLKEGLGTGGEVAAVDSLNIQIGPIGGAPPPPEMMMPLEEFMEAAHFDEVIEANPNCNVVVSFLGLPRDVAEMALWKKDTEERAEVALLGGGVREIQGALQQGLVFAAVSFRPGAKMDEKDPPENPQEAFDKRYLLVTSENVDEIAEKYPGLFLNQK